MSSIARAWRAKGLPENTIRKILGEEGSSFYKYSNFCDNYLIPLSIITTIVLSILTLKNKITGFTLKTYHLSATGLLVLLISLPFLYKINKADPIFALTTVIWIILMLGMRLTPHILAYKGVISTRTFAWIVLGVALASSLDYGCRKIKYG